MENKKRKGMPIKEFLKLYNEDRDKIKNNPICHLVYTPFTGLGKPGFRGDNWLRDRIKIFKKYTLKSLQNQSDQFFIHWISWRPEEQNNDLVKELFSYLCGIEWRVIFTFGGLCWWDDKYKRDKLKKRLKDTMPTLKDIVGDAKYVYETVLASDDMYHCDMVSSVQMQPFAYKRALIHWNGYVHNLKTGEIATWNPKNLPPFYTLMYPADVFLDYKKHFDYIKDLKTHENVEHLYDCVRLPDDRYMVNVHERNISTCFEHPYTGKAVDKKVLKNFGVV